MVFSSPTYFQTLDLEAALVPGLPCLSVCVCGSGRVSRHRWRGECGHRASLWLGHHPL